MSRIMSDEELKLTRRYFLQQAALSSAVIGGAAGVLVATDAMTRADDAPVVPMAERDNGQFTRIYTYGAP
ncbi:MAG: hypothetical protein ACK5Q5_12580 [Planctomycetaceae bacterium]